MRQRNMPTLRSERSWNPISEIARLQRGIEQVFDDFGSSLVDLPSFRPQSDIEESSSHYLMSIDLPGMSKDDVKIEIRGNQLVISGERKEEVSDEKSKRLTERYHGYFQRVFTLPLDADPEKIEANFQDGVLRIAIPKTEAAKPKAIPIGESKGGILEKIREATGVGSKAQEKQKTPERKTA